MLLRSPSNAIVDHSKTFLSTIAVPGRALALCLTALAVVLMGTAALAAAGPSPEERTAFTGSVLPLSAKIAATARAVPPEHLADSLEIEVPLRMRNYPELMGRIGRGGRVPQAQMERDYLPLASGYAAVRRWLESEGFVVTGTDSRRLAVFARGTVAQIQKSLRVEMVRVTKDGIDYHSARTDPSLPKQIAAPVLGINGLQPYRKMIKRAFRMLQRAVAPPYMLNDVLAAYNARGLGVTGSGETIAILIDSTAHGSDLGRFWNANGVKRTGTVETVNVNDLTLPPASGEETIDEEWSSGIAPGAKIVVYAVGELGFPSLDKGLQRIISDLSTQTNLHQLSISLGVPESYAGDSQVTTDSQYFAVLANEGVSVFVSSGDGGSNPTTSGGDTGTTAQVEYYASDPNVTGVGGTSLTLDNTGAVSDESGWYDSGGGASSYFARPSWQTGNGVVSGTTRLVPDVSLDADPNTGGYVVLDGVGQQYGGTSLSSPIWAGFCALMNQARAKAGLGPIGLLNPHIYPLIGTSNFRDITGGYSDAYNAGVGYDEVTGIGVPNVAVLLKTLSAISNTTSLISTTSSPINGGSISGGGRYAPGVTITVAATPNIGYAWSKWTDKGGNTVSSSTSYSFTVSGSMTLVANFTVLAPTPTVTTGLATGTGYYAVTLNGTVNPNGLATTSRCQYGATASYGFSTAGQSVGSGTNPVPVSAGITGLTAATTYHYRLAGANINGTAYGADAVFTTPNPSPAAPRASYYWTDFIGMPGGVGSVDGNGNAARFSEPVGVAADRSGNVYIADTWNNVIRKVTPAGVVTTLAGSPAVTGSGNADGTGSAAQFAQPYGVAVDGSGNIYVADTMNSTIRKVTPAGAVTTLAGHPQVSGSADGTGNAAAFNLPQGVAVDANGIVYVADSNNNTIRTITPGGVVATLAGTPGLSGTADGTGTAARFEQPCGVAVDGSGNVYVADTWNNTIRKVTPGRVVTTLAGSGGLNGSANGRGIVARFNSPQAVAVDEAGNIYVADTVNQTIRKVTSAGVVTTLAGSAGATGIANGVGGTARFYFPGGVAVDGSGKIYVADTGNNTIRKVTPGGVVTTLAGSLEASGIANGTGITARLYNPGGVAVGENGLVYVADSGNNTIRKVTPGGVVTTLAGEPGVSGANDGRGRAAQFSQPGSVAVDGKGNIYVADTGNSTIRKVTPNGVVTTIAGTPQNSGSDDGPASYALFNSPCGLAVDANGNVYVADTGNNTIRELTWDGTVSTIAGNAGVSGSADGTGATALFNGPCALIVDGSANIYVTDTQNDTIRKVTYGGVVTTLAGEAGISGTNDGIGTASLFNQPCAIVLDGSGNLYIADDWNDTIREMTPGGVVTTIGGTPGLGGGANGLGHAGLFSSPQGVAVGANGILYVADYNNNRVVKGVPATDLSALKLSAGVLTPPFAIGTSVYSANVVPAVAGIRVTATASDPGASIQVQINGGTFSALASGRIGPTLALQAGANLIAIRVTAQDGSVQTFSITVNRP